MIFPNGSGSPAPNNGSLPQPKFERGYGALYTEHITQANEGCDFGFLARRGRNPDPDPK